MLCNRIAEIAARQLDPGLGQPVRESTVATPGSDECADLVAGPDEMTRQPPSGEPGGPGDQHPHDAATFPVTSLGTPLRVGAPATGSESAYCRRG